MKVIIMIITIALIIGCSMDEYTQGLEAFKDYKYVEWLTNGETVIENIEVGYDYILFENDVCMNYKPNWVYLNDNTYDNPDAIRIVTYKETEWNLSQNDTTTVFLDSIIESKYYCRYKGAEYVYDSIIKMVAHFKADSIDKKFIRYLKEE